jgi:hypothetical protein
MWIHVTIIKIIFYHDQISDCLHCPSLELGRYDINVRFSILSFIVYDSPLLTHSRHNALSFSSNSILTPPQTRHSLCLCEKRKTGFTVESASTTSSDGLLVSSKGKHGEWDGDGDVDSDLTGFDVALECGGCRARVCEDGDALRGEG